MQLLVFIPIIALILILTAPMRTVWISVNVVVLMSAYCWLTLHLTPPSDKELAWGIAVLYLAAFNALTVLVLAIRIWDCWLTQEAWHISTAPHLIEKILHFANGACLALLIFYKAADVFQGNNHAYVLHIGIFSIALVILSFAPEGRLLAIYDWSIACTLISLTVASALYPAVINYSASKQANGARYCIYLNQSWRFAEDAGDLTLLTFGKGRRTTHATLIIVDDEGSRYGNWSYRQNGFVLPWDLQTQATTHTCPH